MNDLISRQAVIRWVKTECNPYGKPTLDYESGIKVIEHLKRMPSAQSTCDTCKYRACEWDEEPCDGCTGTESKYEPYNGWIPVSVSLPDINAHYTSDPCIVFCDNGAYGFAELEENIFGQVGWDCERDDEYHEPLGTVVAWMPLPEPYRREKE